MLNKNDAYKYETPYKAPCMITQCWTNGTVILQCCVIQIMHNIHIIKPYRSDTNVKDITTEIMYKNVNIQSPVIYLYIILKLVHKVHNWIQTETLALICLGRAHGFLMTMTFYSHRMRLL